MQIVLLSGGSGRRLWPLSNEIRSKQFLKVVRNENNEIESMVQRVYRQISAATDAKITIATSATQVESIKNQLGDRVSLVVEPERRNTFPAVALATAYLYFERNCPVDETVIVLPVDPYVEDDYFYILDTLDNAVQESAADIILVGVSPTYPSEKYGYIIPERAEGTVLPVLEFKEKPDTETAAEYIERGALWNCGAFAFRLSYMMGIVNSLVKCDCFRSVESRYGMFDKTSFDYAVVEKADSVAVIPYDREWKDLGTWNTLTEVMDTEPIGDVVMDAGCQNTHVINELDIPVIVMGAKDAVVAASPDGILVADKMQSSYIRKYVEERDVRPMFEERSWGEYKVLDFAVNDDGTKSLTKRKKIRKGMGIPYQSHRERSEVITVISGKCIITINDRAHEAYAGDTYAVAEGVRHGLEAVTDTEIIEIQVGKELIADGTEQEEREKA